MTPATPRDRSFLLVLVFALIAALAPLAAFAGPGFGPRGGHGRGFGPADRLDLTTEQRDAARKIFSDARKAAGPKRDALRDTHDQLRAALESESPDATTVGNLAIRLDGLRNDLRAIFEKARDDFRALLTDEQRQRLDDFRDQGPGPFGGGRFFGRRGHGFGGPGFGGPGFGGPDDGGDALLGGPSDGHF